MLKVLRRATAALHEPMLPSFAGAIDGDGFALGRDHQHPALDFLKAANNLPHLRGASLEA